METESSKLLQHGHNVERQNLNTTTVDIQALQFIHIEMWTKKWSKTNSSVVNQNTLTGKTKIQQILQARIQYSGLPKHFHHSRTPMEKMKNWKYGEIFFGKNWKNQCDFYSIILLMYLICAVLYGSHTVARSTNYPYKTCVPVLSNQ